MSFERKISRSEMISCVLCHDAPCDQACPFMIPSDHLRSIWFDNEETAASRLSDTNTCQNCDAPCESACVRPHKGPVKKLMTRLFEEVKPSLEADFDESDKYLRTDLCGIPLENPFLLSSSVVGSTYEMCARAFEAGWAGVAFKTVCNLDIHEVSPRFSAIYSDNKTIVGFKNVEQLSDHSVAENMEIFRRLKADYPQKVILASIMGRSEDEWAYLAKQCEKNGADALELNFSCPNMAEGGLGSDIGQIPELVEKYTRAVKKSVSIPVLAKLTPNVESVNPAAEAAMRGGADGIAAINTIKSITGINPHTMVSAPAVHGKSAVGGYSGNAVKPIALKFIAELGHNKSLEHLHISGMGGIECWSDALDFILLGADTVQVTTAIMQYGYRIIDDLKSGLSYYLQQKGISNIKQLTGLALDAMDDNTNDLERDTIVYPKFHNDRCIGCGRCMISCDDGGHQAIYLDENRHPRLNPKKCVGCHLCVLICPERAITNSGKRVLPKK